MHVQHGQTAFVHATLPGYTVAEVPALPDYLSQGENAITQHAGYVYGHSGDNNLVYCRIV